MSLSRLEQRTRRRASVVWAGQAGSFGSEAPQAPQASSITPSPRWEEGGECPYSLAAGPLGPTPDGSAGGCSRPPVRQEGPGEASPLRPLSGGLARPRGPQDPPSLRHAFGFTETRALAVGCFAFESSAATERPLHRAGPRLWPVRLPSPATRRDCPSSPWDKCRQPRVSASLPATATAPRRSPWEHAVCRSARGSSCSCPADGGTAVLRPGAPGTHVTRPGPARLLESEMSSRGQPPGRGWIGDTRRARCLP